MPKQARGLRHAQIPNIRSKLTRPSIYQFPLQTQRIAAPLQFTKGGVFAWFVQGPLNWEFMTLDERVSIWDAQRSRWGQIAEELDGVEQRPVHIRRTTRPYAAFEWAARLDAQADPLPAVTGCETWNTLLEHGQRRLRSTGLDQKVTFIGVWIGDPPSAEAIEDLTSGTDHPRREAVKLLDRLQSLTSLMSGGGMNGTPATAADLSFLMHRSLSMGLPAPASVGVGGTEWAADELGEFTDRREWVKHPFGQPVEVIGDVDGDVLTRHVVSLSMGAMPAKTWPERGSEAWMMGSDSTGLPVEWSLSGVLMKGSSVEPAAVFEGRRARSIQKHYADHGVDLPPAISRGVDEARLNLDEITEGDQRTSPRFQGTIRAALYGTTADEATARARKVTAHYKDRLHMPLARTADQARVLREQVPGEPRVTGGWTRRFGMGYLAAGMPHIDSVVGAPEGFYLGYTSLSHRAVLMDLHWGPEKLNAGGMMTISGSQGSGKSMAMGSVIYQSALAGQASAVFDPSGPLAALTRLPELAPHAREVNLTKAAEGTLTPHQLIPIPLRENYLTDDGEPDELEYQRAIRSARAERSQLLFDVLRMMLSPGLLRSGGVDTILQDAIRSMASHPRAQKSGVAETMWNPRWVIDYLERRKQGGVAKEVLHELIGAAEFPLGSLIIPEHSEPVHEADGVEKTLTVVTMPGLEPPPVDVEREHWGAAERYAQAPLHLAAFFASRFVYSRPREERKNVFLDENHLMARWGSGRALNIRLARDSRKWNTGILVSSQDPDDHLSIGKLDALVGGALVGRLSSESAAQRGCQALGIALDYAPVIMALESGEFLKRDQKRRVAKIKVDVDWHPSLAALVTTPGHARPEYTGELPSTPFLDARLLGGVAA